MTIADTNDIEARVHEGKLEMGVVGSKSPHPDLVHHKLWTDELVVAVPARHRWAKRKWIPFRELSEEPFIMREVGSGTLKIMEEYIHGTGSENRSPLNIVARFGSSTAVKEGIKAGLGVSILSSRAIDTEVKTGILKALKGRHPPLMRTFYLIRDERRVVFPLCQALVDFLLTTSRE